MEKEFIDSDYGYWINPEGDFYPVRDLMAHESCIGEIFNIEDTMEKIRQSDNVLKLGWIKVGFYGYSQGLITAVNYRNAALEKKAFYTLRRILEKKLDKEDIIRTEHHGEFPLRELYSKLGVITMNSQKFDSPAHEIKYWREQNERLKARKDEAERVMKVLNDAIGPDWLKIKEFINSIHSSSNLIITTIDSINNKRNKMTEKQLLDYYDFLLNHEVYRSADYIKNLCKDLDLFKQKVQE